jgi:AraC family transcriptional regulator of adaptative response/methylated-DNA-[protein]-cysteine methyltransferase
MTPGEFKTLGFRLVIRWGLHDGPLGRVLLGVTERGICWLSFVSDDEPVAIEAFHREWQGATLVRDQATTADYVRRAFVLAERSGEPLPLLLRGTNFQLKVWEALLRIPEGNVVTYEHVARAIGHSAAVRAVGTAVGSNPVAILIPCHRVIRKTGVIGNYGGGRARKLALLAREWSARHGADLDAVSLHEQRSLGFVV